MTRLTHHLPYSMVGAGALSSIVCTIRVLIVGTTHYEAPSLVGFRLRVGTFHCLISVTHVDQNSRIVVYSPQIHENYALQSGEGLSILFVLIWLAGDLCNLIGAVIAGLLPTIIILACYVSPLKVINHIKFIHGPAV